MGCQVLKRTPKILLLLLVLSIVLLSSVRWRRGHSWPQGELTQLLLLTGQTSSGNAEKAIRFPSVWELVTATLELRRFHVSFFSPHISPCGCCIADVELYSEVFQKEEKSFLAMHRTARLIVKWRDS